MLRKFISIILFVLFFSPVFSHAQTSDTDPLQAIKITGTDLTLTPSIPGPGQSVNATLQSSTLDLESSFITWSINGQKSSSGKGAKSFSFTNGILGSKTTLSVLIQAPEGTITKSITLNPADVDLLVQGLGYVPPFYKGRALWASGNQAVIVAIPHVTNSAGQEIDSSNLIFKWIKDGSVQDTASGIGRKTLTLTDSILSLPISLDLQVLTDRNTVVASAHINLNPAPIQKILVYEDNPLYGFMFHYLIDSTYPLKEKEVSFSAFPLFFTATSRNSASIAYDWSTNGIFGGQKTSRVTFRAPDSGSGKATVGINVEHSGQLIQSANKSFEVQFEDQSSL